MNFRALIVCSFVSIVLMSHVYCMENLALLGKGIDKVVLPSAGKIQAKLQAIDDIFNEDTFADKIGEKRVSPLEVGARIESFIYKLAKGIEFMPVRFAFLMAMNAKKENMLYAVFGEKHAGVSDLLKLVARRQRVRDSEANIKFWPISIIQAEIDEAKAEAVRKNPTLARLRG